jgi:hypothetical protein
MGIGPLFQGAIPQQRARANARNRSRPRSRVESADDDQSLPLCSRRQGSGVFSRVPSRRIRGLRAENADAIGIHSVHSEVDSCGLRWTSPRGYVLSAFLGPLRPRSGGRGRDPRAARGGEVGARSIGDMREERTDDHLSSPTLCAGPLPLPGCAAERTYERRRGTDE